MRYNISESGYQGELYYLEEYHAGNLTINIE